MLKTTRNVSTNTLSTIEGLRRILQYFGHSNPMKGYRIGEELAGKLLGRERPVSVDQQQAKYEPLVCPGGESGKNSDLYQEAVIVL